MDRAYTATQDRYDRWTHLTMPTLLPRATRDLRAGSGFVVVAEVDANHLTVNAHPDTPAIIRGFLERAHG